MSAKVWRLATLKKHSAEIDMCRSTGSMSLRNTPVFCPSRIMPAANITLKAKAKLSAEAAQIEGKATATAKLGGAQTEINGSATLKLAGGAMTEVKGAIVKVN